MSNQIDVLETMGTDSNLRHASKQEVRIALSNANTSVELTEAILAGESPRIETLLAAKPNVCCILAPKDDEEEVHAEENVFVRASAA